MSQQPKRFTHWNTIAAGFSDYWPLVKEHDELVDEIETLRNEKQQIVENDGRECQHCQNLPGNAARKERQELQKEIARLTSERNSLHDVNMQLNTTIGDLARNNERLEGIIKGLKSKMDEIQHQCTETFWVHEQQLRAYIAGVIDGTIPEKAYGGKRDAAPPCGLKCQFYPDCENCVEIPAAPPALTVYFDKDPKSDNDMVIAKDVMPASHDRRCLINGEVLHRQVADKPSVCPNLKPDFTCRLNTRVEC